MLAGDEEADEPASKARIDQIHVVTQEDLDAGTYNIEDVVLPMPGFKTIFPKHSTAEVSLLLAPVTLACDVCPHPLLRLGNRHHPCFGRISHHAVAQLFMHRTIFLEGKSFS